MAKKFLKIDSVLGRATHLNDDDELLLTSLDGHEGVSVPFTYDLVLMRKLDKGQVPLDKLLGSSARIGLLSPDKDREGNPTYVNRLGVFSQFQMTGLSPKLRRRVYKARLIPAVMFWGGGVTFRVFEKMNVVDIIKEVLDGIRAHSTDVRFDLGALRKDEFPRLAYCVQFRESSFGFLCRLMAQHGIRYSFDREFGQDDDNPGENPGLMPAENDTFSLFGPRDSLVLRSAGTVNAKNVDIPGGDDFDDPTTIAAFARSYQISERDVSVGNYNPITPTKPLSAEKTIAGAYDIVHREGSPGQSLLRREQFPVPAERDPDAKDENRVVKDYAEETIRREHRLGAEVPIDSFKTA